MDNELWEKAQLLVNAGMGHLVKHLYVEEITTQLSQEQLEKLGDISSLVDRMMASSTPGMEKTIKYLIELTRKGVILGPKERP